MHALVAVGECDFVAMLGHSAGHFSVLKYTNARELVTVCAKFPESIAR
jgi:hypothetical protein